MTLSLTGNPVFTTEAVTIHAGVTFHCYPQKLYQFRGLSMFRTVIIALCGGLSLLVSGCSKAPEPFAPEYQSLSVNGQNMSSLRGWTLQATEWSDNRIVLRDGGYESARSMVSQIEALDELTRVRQFRRALRTALRVEGVRDVRILERREVRDEAAEAFQQVLRAPDARFFVWIARGNSQEGRMKAAGISVITAESDDPGTSMEFFLATEDEYERLGGVAVPMARFLRRHIDTEQTSVLSFGRQDNDDAIEIFADQLEAFMLELAIEQARRGLIEGETLSILLGLDQAVPYGLQDPMYDF